MYTKKPYPGKFEGNRSQMVAAAAYRATMDGSAEFIGDCDALGWCASMIDGKNHTFIVYEDNQGFVDVSYWKLGDPEAMRVWQGYITDEESASQDEA